MEQKLDEFFRKKVENIVDKLPDNSQFNEELFWEGLQANMKKKRKVPFYWIASAICLVGSSIVWFVLSSPTSKSEFTHSEEPKKVDSIKPALNKLELIVNSSTVNKVPKTKLRTKTNIPQPQRLKIDLENIAYKSESKLNKPIDIQQDSIHFKPTNLLEIKAKIPFTVVHINEISQQEEPLLKQPKFKIRVAAIQSKEYN